MYLKIKELTEDAIIPVKAHSTDSGFDLFANEDIIIGPGETVVVKTGIAIELPDNHEAQIRPKSGITSKTKLRVQLGTIDESYRGEIGIIVDNIKRKRKRNDCLLKLLDGSYEFSEVNVRKGSYKIKKGDKLAQMVIAPVSHPKLVVVEELDSAERGENGFGSTGVKSPSEYFSKKGKEALEELIKNLRGGNHYGN